jgi:hypothetical protein
MHYEWSFEKLCRYAGRPPVAAERLSVLPDGRLLYRLKRRWRDGTSHIILEPLELIEKLSALVPPPRFNLVRYYVAHRFMWSFARLGPQTKARGPNRST